MTVRRSMAYVGVAGLILAPLCWMARNSVSHSENASSAQCVNNLKNIALALNNYESAYGCFPPAYVADANGKPLYSWRVLLMAELDRKEGTFGGKLASGFHFDEPWDSPANRKFHGLRVLYLKCPSDFSDVGPTTSYVAVVGPGTLFPSDGTTRRLSDVKDGPEQTLSVVEVVESGIHWMEPKELNWTTMSFQLNDRSHPSVSSKHPYRWGYYPGPHAVTVDNHAVILPANLTPETLKALLTIAGGEKIKREAWDGRR